MNQNTLYLNGKRYDDQYGGHTHDIEFYQWLAGKYANNKPIAEFACGTLRVTIPLLRADHFVIGMDIASSMIAYGKEKLMKYAPLIQRRADIHEGDMRTYKTQYFYEAGHGLVIVPFTAFLHLTTREDQIMALKNFWGHLEQDNGYLMIDIFSPDVRRLTRSVGPLAPVMEMNQLIHDGTQRLVRWHVAEYIRTKQLLKWMFFIEVYETSTGNLVEKYYEEATVAVIFPDQWRQLLHDCGFSIVEEWGNHDRTPFTDQSGRMLFLAKRTHTPVV